MTKMMLSELRVKQSLRALHLVWAEIAFGWFGFGLCGSKDPWGRFPLFHILANQTWPATSRAILEGCRDHYDIFGLFSQGLFVVLLLVALKGFGTKQIKFLFLVNRSASQNSIQLNSFCSGLLKYRKKKKIKASIFDLLSIKKSVFKQKWKEAELGFQKKRLLSTAISVRQEEGFDSCMRWQQQQKWEKTRIVIKESFQRKREWKFSA